MSTGNEIISVAFTRKGIDLAFRLGFKVFVPERLSCDGTEAIRESLIDWTGRYFHKVKAMIFIGACGIAVRAIAPYITSKLTDPAVIVIDESGRFVVPILSGHVGGANELAREIAEMIHAQAVITTATDVNNIPAVDEWAVNHDCMIENPENIKYVSGSLLEGHSVGVAVSDSIHDTPFPVTLWLRPRVLVLGAGCHKGIDVNEFERSAMDFLDSAGVSVLSLKALASIDIKANEPALTEFAENHNIPFVTFTADELNSLTGKFSGSQIVKRITGTDCVCERACMLAAGEGAVLLRSKIVYNGITFALARII